MDLETFASRAAVLVRDDVGVLQPSDQDDLVRDAVIRYSRVRPRRVVADLAGDGGFDYALPASWTPEFSALERVEYPAGRREPVYVADIDWMIYRAPAGEVLRFIVDSPKADETIRITFTAQHAVDAASTTVPASDHDIVDKLVAALWCEALASHYSRTSDSSILADSVNHQSRSSEYAARAKRFMSLANELLKVPDQLSVPPAAGQATWGPDQDFLTHPTR